MKSLLTYINENLNKLKPPKITKDNFHLGTKADFSFIYYGDLAYEEFDRLIKKNGLFYDSSKTNIGSSSKYVIENNKTVYRLSDHWGNVASCKWHLKDIPKNVTLYKPWSKSPFVLAKCELRDFESLRKPVEYYKFKGTNIKTNKKSTFGIPVSDLWTEERIRELFTDIQDFKKVIEWELP